MQQKKFSPICLPKYLHPMLSHKFKQDYLVYPLLKFICVYLTSHPGPMNYAHDSLKTHYRYLARFSQELCVAFRANGVFWAGDNQVREEETHVS